MISGVGTSWKGGQGRIDTPRCVNCRGEMSHSCTLSEKPSFEQRVYECTECCSTQSFVTFVG